MVRKAPVGMKRILCNRNFDHLLAWAIERLLKGFAHLAFGCPSVFVCAGARAGTGGCPMHSCYATDVPLSIAS